MAAKRTRKSEAGREGFLYRLDIPNMEREGLESLVVRRDDTARLPGTGPSPSGPAARKSPRASRIMENSSLSPPLCNTAGRTNTGNSHPEGRHFCSPRLRPFMQRDCR